MSELGMFHLATGATTRISRSALPDSPVVPDRSPGPLRLRTAGALHRIASRLDGHPHH